MSDAAEVVLVITLIAVAIEAGGQLFCLLAVLPAFGDWPLDMGIRVHQAAMTDRPHRYLRITGFLSVFGSGTVLVIEHSVEAATVLVACGMVLAIVNAVVSQREWPINDEINSFSGESVPDQYPRLRATWDSQHRLRTVASVGALGLLAVAAVVS